MWLNKDMRRRPMRRKKGEREETEACLALPYRKLTFQMPVPDELVLGCALL